MSPWEKENHCKEYLGYFFLILFKVIILEYCFMWESIAIYCIVVIQYTFLITDLRRVNKRNPMRKSGTWTSTASEFCVSAFHVTLIKKTGSASILLCLHFFDFMYLEQCEFALLEFRCTLFLEESAKSEHAWSYHININRNNDDNFSGTNGISFPWAVYWIQFNIIYISIFIYNSSKIFFKISFEWIW